MKQSIFNAIGKPWPLSWFLVVQGVVIYCGVSWAALSTMRLETRRALPTFREEPLAVLPLYDDPQVVADEQLQRVLFKLRPRLRIEKPKLNDIDHALRCWGADALFDDPECLSGAEMRELLLDSAKFKERYGDKTPALLIDAGLGVRARVQEGAASSSHVDHTLAGQAEVGTPLGFPVITASRQTTLRAMLEQSMRDFSPNQTEYEWSTLAYALYLPPTKSWISQENQEITFDRIAARLMRQEPGQGVCFGHHRLHSLVMLLRVNDQIEILFPQTAAAIRSYLLEMTALLVARQHTDGYFNGHWPAAPAEGRAEGIVPADSLSGRLLSTGHALEWWALAPAEVQPPREVVVRAGQWLCRTIEELSDEQVRENYTFLTHACRALALWRGQFPSQVAGH